MLVLGRLEAKLLRHRQQNTKASFSLIWGSRVGSVSASLSGNLSGREALAFLTCSSHLCLHNNRARWPERQLTDVYVQTREMWKEHGMQEGAFTCVRTWSRSCTHLLYSLLVNIYSNVNLQQQRKYWISDASCGEGTGFSWLWTTFFKDFCILNSLGR